jgi:sigma-B regulation protein RsbU (phosphoserine phosphatase)
VTGIERARILAVDDDAGMRRTMERVLSSLYEVKVAASSTEALDELDASAAPFDVAIIDIQLGGDGDGYSLCQRVKEKSPETEVIFMTGSISQSDEKLYRSLEEGAFYFLFKPFERRVLRALLDRCVRLQRERREKERYAGELADDLDRARMFQQSLLPRRPLEAAGFHLDGRFLPCDVLGGDFYFTIAEREGRVALGVCDIVGHGVSAAMYAGMLRSSLDAARRVDPMPSRLVEELMRGIDFLEAPRLATLFYGLLTPDGTLRYFSAGHPPALWQKRAGGTEWLGSTGVLLTSSLQGFPRGTRDVRLAPGDRILVPTDGVFEARSPDDREWGLEGLALAFESCRGLAPGPALDRVLELHREHCGGRPVVDDATLLLVERAAGSP